MNQPIDHDQLEREQRIACLHAAIMAGDKEGIEAACAAMWFAAGQQEAKRIKKEWPPVNPDYLQGDYEMVGTRRAYEWGQ